jgi:hypothetical protein
MLQRQNAQNAERLAMAEKATHAIAAHRLPVSILMSVVLATAIGASAFAVRLQARVYGRHFETPRRPAPAENGCP